MRRIDLVRHPAWIVIACCAACSGNDGTGDSHGTVTAVVDGVPFSATLGVTATVSAGALTIVAADASGQITLHLATIPSPTDTLVLGGTQPSSAEYRTGADIWSTGLTGSGMIIFNGGTASHVTGTFSFIGGTLINFKTVTNGTFDVTY